MAALTVMMSLAFKPAYLALLPEFERTTGCQVETIRAASADIPQRLAAGEIVDVVIGSARSIDGMIEAGNLVQPRFDLATCGVGAAVKAGAPKPDISTADALKQAVLNARSVVYSHGPSGVYLARLFERMGIAEAIASKVKRVKGVPAGESVACGEAELGFQQMSELLPVEGLDIIGPLPAEVQEITLFSAALHTRSPHRENARALIDHLCGPAAASIIESTGMSALKRQA